ncbi:hypothetical protein C0995_007755 [Termitomyces sp. Mi166|nr:hypothetical protein C0995_007755 [Termitomyces sp. Mi166\
MASVKVAGVAEWPEPKNKKERALQQAAFDALKQAVTLQSVLLFPNNDAPFHVKADSSDFATGVVLSQQFKEDGK